MNLKPLLPLLLIPGCCWMSDGPDDRLFNESYLPYKQPNRDPSYPKMTLVRDEKDGTYFELNRQSFDPWGYRYVVEMRSSYNSVTQYSAISRVRVISKTEEISKPFRLYSISAPYFTGDGKQFIDDKRFECTPPICKELSARHKAGKKFDMVMRFGKTAEDPLVLDEITDPTCYTDYDCTIRQVCCAFEGDGTCQRPDDCPSERQIGVTRSSFNSRVPGVGGHNPKRSPPSE